MRDGAQGVAPGAVRVVHGPGDGAGGRTGLAGRRQRTPLPDLGADERRAGAVHRLDDVEHGDVRGVAREDVAAGLPLGRADQPGLGQRLELLGQVARGDVVQLGEALGGTGRSAAVSTTQQCSAHSTPPDIFTARIPT